jgi:iron-sulfur cluster assembly protein
LRFIYTSINICNTLKFNIWKGGQAALTLCHQIRHKGLILTFKFFEFLLMEATISAPVKLSVNAINEVRRLMNEPGFEAGQSLRIGVKGGGCSGMTYLLGFDKKEADDEYYEIEGIPVLMKKSHEIYLFGMEVDFSDGLNARGFVFKNPNASSTCGCGTSFAV